MGYEENAADRWYRRYLELQETAKANPTRGDTSRGDMDRALAMVEQRLREMNVAVYPARRPVSAAGRAALLAKKQRQLDEAQRQAARQVYREAERAGTPWAIARQRLMDRTGAPADEAERLLRVVREERTMAGQWLSADKAMKSLSEELAKALTPEPFLLDDDDDDYDYDVNGDPPVDTRTSTYTGRRPPPAIVRTRVVTFRGTDISAGGNRLARKECINVQDIDGTEVYVAMEAVQRVVASGEVPGYAALTPEEADSLHLVLVEAEHYQQSLLRQAVVDGDHDPDEVLRVSRAHGAQTAYRKRLGLPAHNWTEDCCGAWVAPITKEVTA